MEFDRIKMTWISWIKHQSSQEGRHHQAYQLSTINTTTTAHNHQHFLLSSWIFSVAGKKQL
jgi:hypothetical protein